MSRNILFYIVAN